MMQGSAGNGVDIVTAILIALGLSSTGLEFLGGVALAVAGAFSASRILAAGMVKNAIPLGFVGTLTTGLFVSVIVALLAENMLPGWPIQLPMAVGGFLSSFIAPLVLKIAARISNRGDIIANRAIDRFLPGSDDHRG